MKLLNIGCGYPRLPTPFINIDNLHSFLKPGTPERTNLDAEPNYVNADLRNGIPFPDNTFDGILASHFIEHLDLQESIKILQESLRALIPNGIILVSVPNASYFRQVHDRDTPENSVELFGEPIHNPKKSSFFEYALFLKEKDHEHKQIFSEDTLWALLTKSGFKITNPISEEADLLRKSLNRLKFSVFMFGTKYI